LENVFFRIGPGAWDCPASAIRKGLKLLLKKAASGSRRELPIGEDMVKRDRALVAAICNNPRVRERIRQLEFGIEEAANRFGQRRGVWVRIVRPDRPLPKLLWMGYARDP